MYSGKQQSLLPRDCPTEGEEEEEPVFRVQLAAAVSIARLSESHSGIPHSPVTSPKQDSASLPVPSSPNSPTFTFLLATPSFPLTRPPSLLTSPLLYKQTYSPSYLSLPHTHPPTYLPTSACLPSYLPTLPYSLLLLARPTLPYCFDPLTVRPLRPLPNQTSFPFFII